MEIYVNDNLKGILTSLKTNKITDYKGILIKMTDEEIVSQDNGKLVNTPYK
jgi:hypothetical protein